MILTRTAATSLIHAEQDYALSKHGPDQHTTLEWLTFIRAYADRAIQSCAFDHDAVSGPAGGKALRVIGGLAITAIEQNGAPSRVDEEYPPL